MPGIGYTTVEQSMHSPLRAATRARITRENVEQTPGRKRLFGVVKSKINQDGSHDYQNRDCRHSFILYDCHSLQIEGQRHGQAYYGPDYGYNQQPLGSVRHTLCTGIIARIVARGAYGPGDDTGQSHRRTTQYGEQYAPHHVGRRTLGHRLAYSGLLHGCLSVDRAGGGCAKDRSRVICLRLGLSRCGKQRRCSRCLCRRKPLGQTVVPHGCGRLERQQFYLLKGVRTLLNTVEIYPEFHNQKNLTSSPRMSLSRLLARREAPMRK